MLTRRAPYAGQRYRHGWVPIGPTFDDRAADAAHGEDALALPAIDAMRPASFGVIPPDRRFDVKDAVFDYMGAGHRQINRHLRRPQDDAPSDQQRYTDGIDEALSHSTLDRDAVVYRGISTPAALFGPRDEWPDSLVGAEWRDPAYQSTSTQEAIARDFAIDSGGVVLRILVPRGTPALKLTGSNRGEHSQAEGELLLGRGARFRVVADHGAAVPGTGVPRNLDVELLDWHPAAIKRGRPHPGQRYRHGWIPVGFSPMSTEQMGEAWKDTGPAYTDEQTTALRTYSSMSYQDINRKLREGHVGPIWQPTVDTVRSAMRPMPADVLVYRRTGGRDVGLTEFATLDELRSTVGKTFTQPAFMSTTVDESQLAGHTAVVHMEVEVPKGTPAAWVHDAGLEHDGELVLDAGTRFEVVSVEPMGQWETRMRVRILSADDPATATRAAGNDDLHHYWTRGAGLRKWLGHPHEWTSLYHHLVKYAPTPEAAKRWASAWFHEVKGFWPGSDLHRVEHGKPPRGNRVGPG